MKIKSLLVRLRPRCFARWRSLPLFGPLLDEFLRWMHELNKKTDVQRKARMLHLKQYLNRRLTGLQTAVVILIVLVLAGLPGL